MKPCFLAVLIVLIATSTLAQQAEPAPPPVIPSQGTQATPAYTPKFKGDPARSDSEAVTLAYMRVVMRAEVGFNKQYGHYATSLSQLVHSGTFTQRMVNPDRGDYTVGYKGKKDGFALTMTPKSPDAQHRSFYAEEDGKIHADETKTADANSPVVETHHW
jgi:opacity protein-like surface antigen